MFRGHRIILNPHQIEQFHQKNLQNPDTILADLLNIPYHVTGQELQKLFYAEPLPQEPRYDYLGNEYTTEMYQRILERLPQWSQEVMLEVQYGVMTDNSEMRCYPTMVCNYKEPFADDLDRFAKTLLKYGEPVVVYCQDLSGAWSFVRSQQMMGWIQTKTVSVTEDEALWNQYVRERSFVQVIASRNEIDYIDFRGCRRTQLVLMGTRLVLHDASCCSLLVSLPQRSDEGQLSMLQTMIPRNSNFYLHFLPLTLQNIVAQMKKMLGEPYGWGGAGCYRDCTSLVSDGFSVFGFILPRNSSQQRQMFGVQSIAANESDACRKALLKGLPPGTVLYFPGHAMVYLGYAQGEYRILHSVYEIGLDTLEELLPHKVCRVMEGHLEQKRANGKSFLSSLTEYWDVTQLSAMLT